MDKYQELREIILSTEKDFIKFYVKRNGAAGTRVRKRMMLIKKICREVRDEVQLRKKTRGHIIGKSIN